MARLRGQVLLPHALRALQRHARAQAVGEREGREAQQLERGEEGVERAVHEVGHARVAPVQPVGEAELVQRVARGRRRPCR